MQNTAGAKVQGRNRDSPASTGWTAAAHLVALWTFAVSQPVLDLVGRQPDFLVAQRLTGAPLIALALAGAIGIPALLALPLLVPGLRSGRPARFWTDGLRALLGAAFALQLLHSLPAAVALLLAAAAGAAGTICLNRYRVFSNLVAIGAIAAVVAPMLFALRPGVRGLLPTVSATSFVPESPIAEAPAIESNLPIVIVVFDELPMSSLQRRDGSIEERRFPSFAALAAGSDWYTRAVTAGLQTAKAIPALLTGRLPRVDSTAHYRDHPSNLFSWLANRGGYRVVAHETVSHLCPSPICGETQGSPWRQLPGAADDLTIVYGHLLLPPALRANLPSVSHTWTGFRPLGTSQSRDRRRAGGGVLNQDVPQLVADFLERIASGTRGPTLYYLHLNLPHRPWKYLPNGNEYTPAGTPISPAGFERPTLSNDEQRAIHGLQRHLLQVGYADRVLGQVLDQLKAEGIFDRALVVVTADHGHSFRPGQRRRSPSETNVEDVLEVPLFVKRPGQTEGTTFHHLVQTIDVVPTIAAELGAQPPWTVDGKPLDDHSPREIRVCCFNDGDAVRAFQTDPVRRQQTLDRQARLFGEQATDERHNFGQSAPDASEATPSVTLSENPFRGVFTAGPRPDLLGRAAEDLTRNTTGVDHPVAGATAFLAGESAYRDVRPETRFVPSLVSGKIEPEIPAGIQLAITVDGTVRATAGTFTHNGESRFAALIEERWLTRGGHAIGVYAIGEGSDPSGDDERAGLTPLPVSGHAPQLLTEGGRLRGVELGNGQVLERVDHLFRGEVEVQTGGFGGMMLSRPGERLLKVDEFFVFGGEDLLYRGLDERSQRRTGRRGDDREQMQFRIFLPVAQMDEHSVRLLARSGTRIQQLYPPKPPGRFELSQDDQGRQVLLRRPEDAPEAAPESIPIGPDRRAIVGSLNGWTSDGNRLFGWAADLHDLGSHQEIVAFLGGRQFWVGSTGLRHRTAAAQAGHLQSGFGILDERVSTWTRRVTAQDRATIEREGLVVYAVSRRNLAARIPFAYGSLERDPDGAEVLPVTDGRRLPVQPPRGGFGGTIDSVSRPARRILLEGWAADLERGERPRQIVIYRNGAFLASLGTNRERPDVAEHYGDPRLLRSGFRGAVPGTSDPETFAGTHRVFAIMLRGVAVELASPARSDPPR